MEEVMKTTTVAKFDVHFHRYIDQNGVAEQPIPESITPDMLIHAYRAMLQVRAFDAKAIALQRTGKMGTFPSSFGQEAIAVGVGLAMAEDDVLCPYYREHGALFQRGVAMDEVFTYWGGDERGSDYRNNAEDFPVAVPIASQCLHAVGVGYAFKYRKSARAVVTTCGDGATSKGDFYEAINAAGVWQLPVVFLVNNNQWAISVPREQQTHCHTIAQKAIAAGLPGQQIDGCDIISVLTAMRTALEAARRGEGPALIEAITYRLCDHTTADDASRYTNPDEHKAALENEPIKRLKRYLTEAGHWTEADENSAQAACQARVEAAVERYLSQPKQSLSSLFDFLYETLPEPMQKQREMLLRQCS